MGFSLNLCGRWQTPKTSSSAVSLNKIDVFNRPPTFLWLHERWILMLEYPFNFQTLSVLKLNCPWAPHWTLNSHKWLHTNMWQCVCMLERGALWSTYREFYSIQSINYLNLKLLWSMTEMNARFQNKLYSSTVKVVKLSFTTKNWVKIFKYELL